MPEATVMATNSNPIIVAAAVPAIMKKLSKPLSIRSPETGSRNFRGAYVEHTVTTSCSRIFVKHSRLQAMFRRTAECL